MTSQYKKINLTDIGKGFLITFGGAFFPSIALSISGGSLPDTSTFLTILGTSLSAGFTYVFKNYFTNSNNKLLEPEKK